MSVTQVQAERVIGAPADIVYDLLANYTDHRPRFLPEAYLDYEVEAGGVGEGTIFKFRVKTGNRVVPYRMLVTEPEPGVVLSEADPDAETLTKFFILPVGEGDVCQVRMETMWRQSSGMAGMIEKVVATRIAKGVNVEQLELLDQYARAFVAE